MDSLYKSFGRGNESKPPRDSNDFLSKEPIRIKFWHEKDIEREANWRGILSSAWRGIKKTHINCIKMIDINKLGDKLY